MTGISNGTIGVFRVEKYGFRRGEGCADQIFGVEKMFESI